MIIRIIHKGENRLGVEIDYNSKLVEIIKKAPDRKWSNTKRLWHLPDNEESALFLKSFLPELYNSFIDTEIDSKEIKSETKTIVSEKILDSKNELLKEEVNKKPILEEKKDILLYESNKRIVLVIKWEAKDIDFIKTLKFHSYDSTNKWWLITNTKENIDAIHSFFGKRINIVENENLLPTVKAFNTIKINELHIIEHIKGRIKIIFKYSKQLVALVKTFPYYAWDKENGWWTTVNTKYVVDTLEKYCNENNITVKYFNKTNSVIKGRQLKEQIVNYRICPQNFIDKLLLLRYSDNTIKTYCSSFEEFINFYNTKKINEITEPEIIEFTRYLVVERGVSASYQNQAINAIKFYYEKVLGESRKFYNLDRPKKEKTLPEVLAKEDINKIINATENLKHKCIIILIYSAGLRVSEAVNMKLVDIDSKRGVIIIKQGKGKKDRNSLLSNKTLLILREYYKLYQPKEYLFTGMTGGKYTASSILKVVKNAAEKAGIKKKVTTHTLRHSFATHLLEQGVNLRYIQSLLGHESSKTTEIYTHITSTAFNEIKNPLDDMQF